MKNGVRKGDVVVIYMPMVPQAMFTMLACARIGAPHSLIFGGFASKELSVRIDHAKVRRWCYSLALGLKVISARVKAVLSVFTTQLTVKFHVSMTQDNPTSVHLFLFLLTCVIS